MFSSHDRAVVLMDSQWIWYALYLQRKIKPDENPAWEAYTIPTLAEELLLAEAAKGEATAFFRDVVSPKSSLPQWMAVYQSTEAALIGISCRVYEMGEK